MCALACAPGLATHTPTHVHYSAGMLWHLTEHKRGRACTCARSGRIHAGKCDAHRTVQLYNGSNGPVPHI
eukprot:6533163-Alexandrium_andersonii.AAC.1